MDVAHAIESVSLLPHWQHGETQTGGVSPVSSLIRTEDLKMISDVSLFRSEVTWLSQQSLTNRRIEVAYAIAGAIVILAA
jgi:hypothetical protein